MVISMVSIPVSIMVTIKVRQNINKMKWMNHISALRDFLCLNYNDKSLIFIKTKNHYIDLICFVLRIK